MTKHDLFRYLTFINCSLFFGCSDNQPTPPKLAEGVLRGKVTEASTLPIAGAQINIGYDLGQQTAPPSHRVKMPSPGFAMSQNYPNPYNPVSSIRFMVGNPVRVVLQVLPRVYTANVIATLIDRDLAAGYYEVLWNSILPDSMLLTNGNHLYRMQVLESGLVIFEDDYYLFHNSIDPVIVPRMKPMTTADVNGDFSFSYASTSIGDTIAVTVETGPDILGGMIISDSITIFVSRTGYKTATRRVLFREKDAPVVNVVLERQ
jgi:hypothetical protein